MDFRNSNIDLVGKLKLWFGISLAVIVIGLVSWAAFGLNLGIDFRGGGQFQYRLPLSQRPKAGQEVALLDEARGLLEKRGLSRVQLQVVGGDTLRVSTLAREARQLGEQEKTIRAALGTRFKGTDAQNRPQELRLIGQQFVGPVVGEELRRNAIAGVVLGVLCIAGWIWIRYNFEGDGLRYAAAGIVALVHDVLVLLGIFALIGRFFPRVEIDGAFIAALLTVVGYSINDSVVIFDRIRENLRQRRREAFERVVNDSLLETMSRSINTGLTVLIMLLVLLFLGGESVFNFVLAMLVGIVSGLYSSIFNASMVLIAWHRWDEQKALQARAARGSVGRVVNARDTTARPSLQRSSSLQKATPSLAAQRPMGAANVGLVTPSGSSSSAPASDNLSRPMSSELPRELPVETASTDFEATDASSAVSESIESSRAAAATRKARSRRRY